jgi:hypothetical protein
LLQDWGDTNVGIAGFACSRCCLFIAGGGGGSGSSGGGGGGNNVILTAAVFNGASQSKNVP